MANPKALVHKSLRLFDELYHSDDSSSKTLAAEGLIVAAGKIFRDKIKGVFVTRDMKDLIKRASTLAVNVRKLSVVAVRYQLCLC